VVTTCPTCGNDAGAAATVATWADTGRVDTKPGAKPGNPTVGNGIAAPKKNDPPPGEDIKIESHAGYHDVP
jgi:hypothetical protein